MEENCQAPQAPILCVNNCGFFGAAATMNMCSKCYKDYVVKQQQEELAVSSIQSIVNGTSSSAAAVTLVTQIPPSSSIVTPTPQASAAIEEVKQGPKRCGTCKKRVGLTGFNCRCGHTFCAIHRYSDKHECSFDYRTEAQEAIAKANPVVKADKLDKI